MYISIWVLVLLIMVVFISGFTLCALLTANRYDDERSEDHYEGNKLP
jgi:NADH:ubiquinone oxidoreductase subunit 3 (subunit A)